MPHATLLTIVAFGALLSGCSAFTEPSIIIGTKAFTCQTQPRAYISPDGVITWEIDTYEQATPCPTVPID